MGTFKTKFSKEVEDFFKQKGPPRLSKKERSRLKRLAKGPKQVAVKTVTAKVQSTRTVRVDDPIVAHAKRAVHLHRKTMERLIRSVRMDSSGKQSILDAIAKVQETACTLKATYQVGNVKPRKLLASARREAVTDVKTSCYQKKTYVSKEQRAANKAKAGVVVVSSETSKATRLQVVGGTQHVAKPKVWGYKANPTPSSRKERMKLAKELKSFFKKPKYAPYNRQGMEVLSKQAA